MPKRKRGEADALHHVLSIALRNLVRDLKIARGIERQKLGRRQKGALAKKDAPDNARIEAEIQALKKLDIQSTAEHHLLKTLHRIKSIASTGALPPHNPPTSLPEPATSNVTARLYNAQVVKAALATSIQQVRQALGLDVTATASAAKRAKKEETREEILLAVEEEERQGFSDIAEGFDRETEDLARSRDAQTASDSDNQDFAEYERLLAPFDEDESDLDDSRDSSAAQLKRELAQAVASISAGDDSSDTVTLEQGLSDTSMTSAERPSQTSESAKRMTDALPGLATKRKLVVGKDPTFLINGTKPTDGDSISPDQPPSPKLRPTSSAFLPTLTMGGYWSGSEGDEPEDIGEHLAPRKNRRGQRARQAIAEAKFGAAAKHVVEGRPANKPKDARGAGWDMKRGATSADDVRGFKGMDRKERRSRMKGAREAGASGGNAIPIAPGKGNAGGGEVYTPSKTAVVKPKRDDIGSLHPSWEAKRKAKAETGKIVPFQGKKTTFD
ncbi:cellular morphogenesis protein Bud22 [Venturia nashicola]|uniref:Cellular morphogenesis protein Bud22 n=1 Tax=Venturia nashicola TaxID=86259 RepID=A0A4Z1NXD3_9PEZI|nr:cellular morphogenesis protein Bud22 [Venturia nashicola]